MCLVLHRSSFSDFLNYFGYFLLRCVTYFALWF